MGYSPWGHKELGMTKVTWHARMHAPALISTQDSAKQY